MNNDSDILKGEMSHAPWIEIKEMMLKNFLHEDYDRLMKVKSKLINIQEKKSQLNKNFENAFLIANQETL
jgi:hypothetical protein